MVSPPFLLLLCKIQVLISLPIAVQLVMLDNLGSEKMEIALEDGMFQSENPKYLCILYTFLFSALKLS